MATVYHSGTHKFIPYFGGCPNKCLFFIFVCFVCRLLFVYSIFSFDHGFIFCIRLSLPFYCSKNPFMPFVFFQTFLTWLYRCVLNYTKNLPCRIIKYTYKRLIFIYPPVAYHVIIENNHPSIWGCEKFAAAKRLLLTTKNNASLTFKQGIVKIFGRRTKISSSLKHE